MLSVLHYIDQNGSDKLKKETYLNLLLFSASFDPIHGTYIVTAATRYCKLCFIILVLIAQKSFPS